MYCSKGQSSFSIVVIISCLYQKRKKKKSHQLWRKPVQMIVWRHRRLDVLKWIGARRRFTRALQNFACSGRLLLFFFRWVDSTSPSHCWRSALTISSSFLFIILTVIYIQYLETDMKFRHGNFRRWRSESFLISNLPPQMKKVSIGGR